MTAARARPRPRRRELWPLAATTLVGANAVLWATRAPLSWPPLGGLPGSARSLSTTGSDEGQIRALQLVARRLMGESLPFAAEARLGLGIEPTRPNLVAIERALSARFGGVFAHFGNVRRRPNELDYPSSDQDFADAEESRAAIARAKGLVDAAEELLKRRILTTF